MKELSVREHLDSCLEIASAATSSEETGNPIYPPARKTLSAHGIPFGKHSARKMTMSDYYYYDMIIAMDDENLWGINRITGNDPEGKVSLLMDYTERPGNVSDPWYTRDFETTWRDVDEGCRALIRYVRLKLKSGV